MAANLVEIVDSLNVARRGGHGSFWSESIECYAGVMIGSCALVVRRGCIAGSRGRAGVLMAAVLLGACTHDRQGPVSGHFQDFSVTPPTNDTVHVCHSYGCRMQTKVRFGSAELNEIKAVMAKTRKADTPDEERRAVAYAIGWIERHVGEKIGTKSDRAGMDFGASGDPTQQDCVDEATNTTSYLLILERNGLLKHHSVGTPFAKEDYTRGVAGWTHWTGVLKEVGTGQRFAVDSWIYENGENPAIVPAETWYVDSLAELPASTR